MTIMNRETASGWFRAVVFASIAGVFTAGSASAADKGSAVRFGTPPWPGATVKTEVATQLLEAMGYATETTELGTEAVILNGLASDDLDVYLALWYPLSAGQLDPLIEQGKVTKLGENLREAVLGLAVPRYVHEGGVDSVDDLSKYADRFNREIYGIEAGNYWNEQAKTAIKENRYGLGDWKLVPSSTSAMLTQVERAVKKQDWILFYGWRPHWMNVPFDLYYLTAPEGSAIADVQSTVYTIARSGFAEQETPVVDFLRQYRVDLAMQDKWILEHGKNNRDADEVAREWIRTNLDAVKAWVDGVEAADGGSGWRAVQSEFDS